MPKPHVRIEKPAPRERGAFDLVRDDRIVAVGKDGAEVDISHCVTEWHEHSRVGEARRVEVVLLGFYVQQEDGALILDPEATA